jgi:hypothetical protein
VTLTSMISEQKNFKIINQTAGDLKTADVLIEGAGTTKNLPPNDKPLVKVRIILTLY